ncbi:dihydrolipoyllysine-residue acetyltransferase [Aureococcus anophagefferens]|nr:dihydrolipoyllysine-residue acetyltransferase [Aureococcus anophagefferens]
MEPHRCDREFRGSVGTSRTGAGGYCPLASSYPNPCPAGTYNNESGATSEDECDNCLAGYYCSGLCGFQIFIRLQCSGSNSPYPTGPCYPGYYCESASITPTQHECAAGKYSGYGAAECTDCEPGTYQPYRAQATCVDTPAGYYADGYGSTTYLLRGRLLLPAGTASYLRDPAPRRDDFRELLVDVTECSLCDAGYYCGPKDDGSDGLSAPTAKCDAGYYCSSGAFDSQGAYCIDLDVYVASYDPATDSNVTYDGNATSIGYLKDCGDGGGCPRVCAGGYFCRNANEGAPSTTPLCLDDACAGDYGLCPAGSSCANGTSEPAACAAGTYGPTVGLDACLACPAGRMCNGTNTTHYADCPRGGFCPAGTGATPEPCPKGRYGHATNLARAADCAPCPEGLHCPEPGLVAPGPPCDAGFVCEIGSVHANGTARAGGLAAAPCAAGGYCRAGSAHATPCPVGTFSPDAGETSPGACGACTAGSYCDAVGLAAPAGLCEPGYYCEAGATPRASARGGRVPARRRRARALRRGDLRRGRGRRAAAAECTPCLPGHFCNDTGLEAPAGTCAPGHFCTEGAIVAAPDHTW